jgi:hypothetical protein
MYLIPSRVLAGRVMVLLRNYSRYIVGDISSLMRFSGPAELAVPGRQATCGPPGRVDRPGRLATGSSERRHKRAALIVGLVG